MGGVHIRLSREVSRSSLEQMTGTDCLAGPDKPEHILVKCEPRVARALQLHGRRRKRLHLLLPACALKKRGPTLARQVFHIMY